MNTQRPAAGRTSGTRVWVSDPYQQAAITAATVPDGVRIETRATGKNPVVIVLPLEETADLVQQILEAMRDLVGGPDQ